MTHQLHAAWGSHDTGAHVLLPCPTATLLLLALGSCTGSQFPVALLPAPWDTIPPSTSCPATGTGWQVPAGTRVTSRLSFCPGAGGKALSCLDRDEQKPSIPPRCCKMCCPGLVGLAGQRGAGCAVMQASGTAFSSVCASLPSCAPLCLWAPPQPSLRPLGVSPASAPRDCHTAWPHALEAPVLRGAPCRAATMWSPVQGGCELGRLPTVPRDRCRQCSVPTAISVAQLLLPPRRAAARLSALCPQEVSQHLRHMSRSWEV